MQQSHSEANRFLVSVEIPHILWNPKVNCRVRKLPTLVPILSQTNLPHTLPSYLFKIPCIILPSTLRSFKYSLSFIFLHQNPVCISFLSHACRMTRVFDHPRFDNPNNIWRGIRIMRFLIVQFSAACYCVCARNDSTWGVEI
jgi:hypothetical protein